MRVSMLSSIYLDFESRHNKHYIRIMILKVINNNIVDVVHLLTWLLIWDNDTYYVVPVYHLCVLYSYMCSLSFMVYNNTLLCIFNNQKDKRIPNEKRNMYTCIYHIWHMYIVYCVYIFSGILRYYVQHIFNIILFLCFGYDVSTTLKSQEKYKLRTYVCSANRIRGRRVFLRVLNIELKMILYRT